MKLIHRFVLLGILLASLGTYGQGLLSVHPNALNALPPSIASGSIDTVFVSVFKVDTSTVSFDSIGFGYSINGITDSVSDPNSISYTRVGVGAAFMATDSIIIPLIFHINQPRFLSPGPSVVVIWPISYHHAVAIDSARWTFSHIISGIVEAEEKSLKVFMAERRLLIECDEPELMRQVRVFDTRGSMLLERKISAATSIPMDRYATGIYLAEVTFSDNSRKTFKIWNPGW